MRSSTSPLMPSRRWANRPASVLTEDKSESRRALASRMPFCSSATRPAKAARFCDWPAGSAADMVASMSSSLVRRPISSWGISWPLPTLLSSALVSRASLACVSASVPSERPSSSTRLRMPALGRVPSTPSMSATRRRKSLTSSAWLGCRSAARKCMAPSTISAPIAPAARCVRRRTARLRPASEASGDPLLSLLPFASLAPGAAAAFG